VFGDVLDDIERQLDRFIFPGFITAVGSGRLDDVKRYLDAVIYRLEKLRENPDRDRDSMARVTDLEAEFDSLTDVLSWSPELVEVAWMLQELRISLFAQPIGVRGSVSEQRVAAALEHLLT
jgi:ATP-dependent helicase HrpA